MLYLEVERRLWGIRELWPGCYRINSPLVIGQDCSILVALCFTCSPWNGHNGGSRVFVCGVWGAEGLWIYRPHRHHDHARADWEKLMKDRGENLDKKLILKRERSVLFRFLIQP